MKEIFANFTFFGVVISLAGYELGILLKKKFKFPLLNPLLVSIVFVIGFLVLFRIDYDTYNNGAKYYQVTILSISSRCSCVDFVR